jgi:hypothetical protein
MPRRPRPSLASRLLTGLLALTLVAGGLVAPPLTPPVAAATIAVTSTSMGVFDNDGLCTLIEAILSARLDVASGPGAGECPAGAGVDTITLQAGATYTLTQPQNFADGPNGLPLITSEMIILGNGATIERSYAGGTPNFRLLYVASTAILTVTDLTLRNGNATPGGAIHVDGGTLSMGNVAVIGNRSGEGGGV